MSDQPLQPVSETQTRSVSSVFATDPKDAYWSSLNPKLPSEQALLFEARLGEIDSLGEALNSVFSIKHLLLHPVEFTTQTGEIRQGVRSVMISPEGDMLATVSEGVLSCLKFIVANAGQPPFVPPIKVTIKRKVLKNGHQLYQLIPLFEESEPTPTKGAKSK